MMICSIYSGDVAVALDYAIACLQKGWIVILLSLDTIPDFLALFVFGLIKNDYP